MTRPAFIYILPIYILFWILRFFFNKNEKKQVIIGTISCVMCGILILSYCALMKNQYGKYELTTISNENNLACVILSEAYNKDSNNENIIKTIDEIKRTQTNPSCFAISGMLRKLYSSEEINQFVSSTIKTKPYAEYLIKKTMTLGSSNIGTTYVDKSDSSKFYNNLGNITIPITFALLYVAIIISIVYMIRKLIKEKQIDWILAFCISLIVANIFTIIVCGPNEHQRLFAPSVVVVLIFVAYVLENIF